jgi:hypothetical protein
VPKAIVLHGAGGTTTLTWFTVPHNPEQVKTLPNGSDWHLGFAALDVGMPLQAGKVAIPVANYKLDAHRDDKGEFTALVLTPIELWRAARARRGEPADPERIAAAKKALAEKGLPERIVLPIARYDDGDAEHLEFLLLTRGYEAKQNFSAEPKGGASWSLMATFGDLHRKLDLQETFPVAAAAK